MFQKVVGLSPVIAECKSDLCPKGCEFESLLAKCRIDYHFLLKKNLIKFLEDDCRSFSDFQLLELIHLFSFHVELSRVMCLVEDYVVSPSWKIINIFEELVFDPRCRSNLKLYNFLKLVKLWKCSRIYVLFFCFTPFVFSFLICPKLLYKLLFIERYRCCLDRSLLVLVPQNLFFKK